MKKYKDQTNHQSLEGLLSDYASGQCWPTGNNKPAHPATDYVEKVELCMGLMMHALVAAQVDGVWTLIPMRPLPEEAASGKMSLDLILLNASRLYQWKNLHDENMGTYRCCSTKNRNAY